jgi:hypothetical protein
MTLQELRDELQRTARHGRPWIGMASLTLRQKNETAMVVISAASTVGLVGIGLAAPATVSAAVRYFSVTRVVTGSGTAYCPSGWKVTGGGALPLPSNYFNSSWSDEYQLTGSYPYSLTSWRATATRVHGYYSSSTGWHFSTYSYSPSVRAICVY